VARDPVCSKSQGYAKPRRDQRDERRGWKHRKWKRPPYGQRELKHALTLNKSATGNDQAKRRWTIGARAMCA